LAVRLTVRFTRRALRLVRMVGRRRAGRRRLPARSRLSTESTRCFNCAMIFSALAIVCRTARM